MLPEIAPHRIPTTSRAAPEGFGLEPDRVLLCFFVGNDFEGQRRSLVSCSYVASLIRYVLARWSKFEGQIIRGDLTYDDTGPKFTDDAYLQIELQRSTIFVRDNRAFEGQF